MSVQKRIDEIIDNFRKQQQYYLQIFDLSSKQLAFLTDEQWIDKQEELNKLLEERQQLNNEVDALNLQNKFLQEQIMNMLALPEFVLSRLEGKLAEVQYTSLREVVESLGALLTKINAADEQNHTLIKKKAGPGRIQINTNRQQAQNAYQQAIQQGKKS